MDEQAMKRPGTPEWWLDHLCKKFWERDHTYDIAPDVQWRQRMYWRSRRERLNMLWAYFIGQPPLPQVAEHYRETFRDVLRKGRATYAPMAIQPMLDRMELNSVRTGVTDGIEGDDVAKRIMEYSNGAAAIKDAFMYSFVMSDAYLMVIPAAKGSLDKTPLITAEDPRTCIGEPDPANPNHLRAALKLGYDPVLNRVNAWLFHGGVKYTASCEGNDMWALTSYGATSFEWSENPQNLPELATVGATVPVVQLPNARCMGEFEPHIDLLDRINDMILQRIVLTHYQSFKQRAIIGDLEADADEEDTADAPQDEIDWNNVFSADPGALWRVPAGTSFWESNPADMTGLLSAIRDDVKEFAAVTATPLHLITPDAANQSAEGAALMREGLVFKVKDRRSRFNPRLVELFKMAFAFAGAADRTKSIELLWGPVEAFSLTEKANAVAQTRGVLSRARQLQDLMEMTPDQIQQNKDELSQDAEFDKSLGEAGAGQIRVTETTSSPNGNTPMPPATNGNTPTPPPNGAGPNRMPSTRPPQRV